MDDRTAPAAATHQFAATIEAGRRGGALVRIPFDVREEFGTRGQVKVHATFDGAAYRGSLAPMGGGEHALGVTKAVRDAIGKDVGDEVRVALWRDTVMRTVDLPPELSAALAKSPEARRRYEALSHTHRREYAQWVAEAKRQETRDRRAARTVERLADGVGGGRP